jgi:hypothetical protein
MPGHEPSGHLQLLHGWRVLYQSQQYLGRLAADPAVAITRVYGGKHSLQLNIYISRSVRSISS